MVASSPQEFFVLPYTDRQLIVVVDSLPEEGESSETPVVQSSGWTGILSGMVARITRLSWKEKALAFVPGYSVYWLAKVYNDTRKAQGAGTADSAASMKQAQGLRIIDRATAGGLRFPLGHPRNKVVYVGHPAIPAVYYPLAEFHRRTFEHKFAEAVQLLMSLSAREIEVEHQAGWGKEFSGKLNIPLAAAVEAGGKREARRDLLFKARFQSPRKPALPDQLIWYHHEPTWHQVAEGRLKYGLQEFSLALRYEDDYGVNAGLQTSLIGHGLELGGKFEGHESTVWRMVGCFA
jgi:hypothetical protein